MKILVLTLIAFLLGFPITAQTNDPRTSGNVPIIFYGELIDQSNQPVAGVKVDVYVASYYLKAPREIGEKVNLVSLLSDADGKFVLENTNGVSIQFSSIDKEGYKLSANQVKRSYLYSPSVFHPDINNPVVFKMWKKQGAESLVESAWHGLTACDGAPMKFDLRDGKLVQDGSLQITCMRTPLTSPPPGNARFDYKFQIKLVGGGIQPTEDEFTYFAPVNGYLPSFAVEQHASDPKWWGRVTKEFYVKTADGYYGRLSVDWYAAQNAPNHLEWNCSVNPSGSRNLER